MKKMTNNFTINNESSPSEIFEERILYEFFAFNTSLGISAQDPAGIKNYWRFENILYGKVDKGLIVIEPNKRYLSSITGEGNVQYALTPVADSFREFQNSFKIPSQSGRLVEDSFLNSPEIIRSYIDSDILYNDHLTNVVAKFNRNNVLSKPLDNKIANIKDYAGEFFRYIFNGHGLPLTKVSYILSDKVSPLSSGLSIEIADLDPADNRGKQTFIESPNFEFYRQTAINSGFLIDKNIPWRMNFDISSPANKEKIAPAYETQDVANSFLVRHFQPAYLSDLEYLISLVIVGYNSLVSDKGYYMNGRCKFERTPVEKEDVLQNTLPMYYWVKRYCQLRNIESGNIYTKPEIDKIIQYALDLQGDALEYISSKFRLPYLFEGSTVYANLKKYYLEKNNISLDNFSEHVKIVIKNSINKIY